MSDKIEVNLRVWTIQGFRGWCPTQTAAVVVATSAEHARDILCDALPDSLKPRPGEVEQWDIEEVDTSSPDALILSDGDY